MRNAPDEQELLERVLSGDWALDRPEVLEHFLRDPGARARFEDSLSIAGSLDSMEDFRRSVIAEAEELDDAPGVDAARAFVRAELGLEDSSTLPVSRSPSWLGAAVAAGVLLFVGLWLRSQSAPEPAEVLLGGAAAELLRPVGGVERYGPFEWSRGQDGGALFEVVVYDAADGELARSPRRSRTTWSPDPTQERAWPDAIRWEVRAYDALGEPLAAGPAASASRSR